MVSEKELENQIADAANLEQLGKPLQELLAGPYTVLPDGRLYCIKVLVERVSDVRVIIRLNDHPPPH
ncbi:MAG: hypothetical protein MUQ20_03900, partial [Deltaproteobacteria bacterium]|nr:hypothetical protein [Deltaproteobacteria bacterium]